MAASDQVDGESPSDREGDTPEDLADRATASAEPPADDDLIDSALLELAAAPSVSPRSRKLLRPEPGTVIADRYRIDKQLGEGGMGVVFLARDVGLDRPVALKLQSRLTGRNDLARLKREAKAMARLSHPNVVVVHEVGTHEGHVFLAMEYVEGVTAREWIDRKPDWRAVIDVLVGAGRGLAAAHDVGIVHRDFKPENVMLGSDGRPRVVDFGLARDGPTATARPVEPIGDGRLTATGAVLGTPAYMSPEQFAGTTVGPASDQFSFCVMAYEALFGRRPFRGRTTAELVTSVSEGHIRSPPSRSPVPPAITRAVVKGLLVDPTQRHPSMAALVQTLERIVRARRRRVWIGVAASAAVLASVLGYRGAMAMRPEPCEDVADALGEAWDDPRRDAVAAVVDDAVVDAIDAWASAWIAERKAVCDQNQVRGEQSDFEHGLRMACLDRHGARLDGFTAGLADAAKADVDARIVDEMLPTLDQCRDVTSLEKLENRFDRRSTFDTAEQDRAHLEGLRLLAQAQVLWSTFSDGATELVDRAEAIAKDHELPEIEHMALAVRADLVAREGDAEQADALRARSIEIAAAQGQDLHAADAIRQRADAALEAGDISAARTHLQYFDLFLARVALESRARIEMHAAVTRGRLALAEHKPREAIEWFEKVVAAPELHDPYAAANYLGSAYLAADRPKDAVVQLEHAVELRRAKGIAKDADLAGGLVNLANVRMQLEDYDAAVKDLAEAHAIAKQASGDQRMLLGILLGSWGAAERHRGEHDRARALQEESLAVRTDLLGEQHPFRAYATDELGELARIAGDHAAAQRWYEQSIALRRAGFGADHPSVAHSLKQLGQVHLDRGATTEARETLSEAKRILDTAEEDDPEARAEVDALLARTTP